MEINTTSRMGYGEADITPDYPTELVGFFRPDNRSTGVFQPIKLQAMVWEAVSGNPGSGNKSRKNGLLCLITIDSLGFTVQLSDLLRSRIAGQLGTEKECIMLAFSHTHSAPNAAEEPEYFEMVCRQAEAAVKKAVQTMAPAYAVWGIAENTIGVNRRNDPEAMDRRLGVLKVTAPECDAPALLLLRVTAHANILSGDNTLISADYFGVTRQLLEERYNCHVMMVQGASGDIRPRFHQDNMETLEIHCFEEAGRGFSPEYRSKYTAQSRHALDQTAEAIGSAIAPMLDSLITQPVTLAAMFSSRCRFTADVPTLSQAAAIAEEAAREAAIDGSAWLEEVTRLRREGITSQSSEAELQYFFLNDGCFCGIANEAMCRISLDAARQAGTPFFFLNGYTNGCNSYLPTAKEYDQGGYEVLWSNLIYFPYHGRVMPFNRETADHLVQEAVRGWRDGLSHVTSSIKFYIASSLKNYKQVRELSRLLTNAGWEHTYDWTKLSPAKAITAEELTAIGEKEYEGIRQSDIVIILTPQGKGTHTEFGMAIALNKKVYLCHSDDTYFQCDDNTSTFYWLPQVNRLTGTTEEIAFELLKSS